MLRDDEIYDEIYKDMIAVAKRENNRRRNYLAVNRKQGKHVPVVPSEAFSLYRRLSDEIRPVYDGRRTLVIGFAETATAIGAAVAADLSALYLQTTREEMGGVSYLFFSETHSHAAEQRLVKEELERAMEQVDRIVFAEDELTTGNTILSAIEAIRRDCGRNGPGEERSGGCGVSFSVISVLNGMDESAVRSYQRQGIGLHYLVKSDHSAYSDAAARCRADGEYFEASVLRPERDAEEISLPGRMDPRRLVRAADYREACRRLAEQVMERIPFARQERVLVLGTEECMYPALFLGRLLEEAGCDVRSHSTTRSPIEVSREDGYPLHSRYQLASLYDRDRTTYLYDLERCDKAVVVTDSLRIPEEGRYSLVNALNRSGNREIYFVRWNK